MKNKTKAGIPEIEYSSKYAAYRKAEDTSQKPQNFKGTAKTAVAIGSFSRVMTPESVEEALEKAGVLARADLVSTEKGQSFFAVTALKKEEKAFLAALRALDFCPAPAAGWAPSSTLAMKRSK